MTSITPGDESNVPSDEELARLERAAEQGTSVSGMPFQFEYDRCYQSVEALTGPLRQALFAPSHHMELPDYDELQEIGRGGMGVVYRGVHRQTRRTDAIKVIRPDRLAVHGDHLAQELRQQFRREAQLAARVAHEHIVPIYHVGEVNGCSWYSMQCVDGKSLKELTSGSPLSADHAAKLMEQISRAVNQVHRHGVLHGDIKPHNILVQSEDQKAMITDFGLAHVTGTSDLKTGVAGTPAYMAPELACLALRRASAEELAAVRTSAADIYSLGATLWCALTGNAPVDEHLPLAEQLKNVAAGRLRLTVPEGIRIPAELNRICRRCVQSEPELRYSTAGQLADELLHWLNRPRWNRSFPKLQQQLLMIVAPAMVLAGLGVSWLQRLKAPDSLVALTILSSYPALFMVLARASRKDGPPDPAQRELWSIWTGHFAATVASLVSLKVLLGTGAWLPLFYPMWAGHTSIAFFAKSGNFSVGYRWIGTVWAILAIVLALIPEAGPILFGFSAALTCLMITVGDESYHNR